MQSDKVKFAIEAENYEMDIEAGIPPHLIEPDPYRRYNVSTVLKYGEALALLHFVKAHDATPGSPELAAAFDKVLDALLVQGFEWPYATYMHPDRPPSK